MGEKKVEGLGVIILNGIGMLFCFFIGLVIAYWGFKIFKDGDSESQHAQLIEWGSLKVTSKGSGSIVMSTAVIWAIVGFNVSPSITHTADGPNYTSISDEQNGELKIASSVISNPNATLDQPDVLKGYLAESISAENYSENYIMVNGLKGYLDVGSLNYLVDEVGNATLTAQANGEFGNVTVLFKPKVNEQNQLVFEAEGVAKKIKNEPNKAINK
ncbi:hypothetical protein CGK33_10205 [Vibrio parahaemolyticus]|nr:hypothetical protein CGK33_10205 [Vibrio parahaemolyticus]